MVSRLTVAFSQNLVNLFKIAYNQHKFGPLPEQKVQICNTRRRANNSRNLEHDVVWGQVLDII